MRLKTTKDVLEKKYDVLELDGIYRDTLGQPENNGLWLIYGEEKHGKTTLSLILANYLSSHRKTAFVMAEQGFDKDFQDVLKRLSFGIKKSQLYFEEYIPITELDSVLKRRHSPDIIFLDNATVYQDELKNGVLRKLLKDHQNKLFILIAHEEKGEPYTATAKLAKKLAKRIVRVEGMKAMVQGRAPGGSIIIDEEKAQLYWGTESN